MAGRVLLRPFVPAVLYDDFLGAPLTPHSDEGLTGGLSASARLHVEFLMARQRLRALPRSGGPAGPLTAIVLQQLLQGATAWGAGAPQGPPRDPKRRCRDFLMSLPTTCEDPKENQGPRGGPTWRWVKV